MTHELNWHVCSLYFIEKDPIQIVPSGKVVRTSIKVDALFDSIIKMGLVSYHEMEQNFLDHCKKFGPLGVGIEEWRIIDGVKQPIYIEELNIALEHVRQICICKILVDAIRGSWTESATKVAKSISDFLERSFHGVFSLREYSTSEIKFHKDSEHISVLGWKILKEIINKNISAHGECLEFGYNKHNVNTPISTIYLKLASMIPNRELDLNRCQKCNKKFITIKGNRKFCPSETGGNSKCGRNFHKAKQRRKEKQLTM